MEHFMYDGFEYPNDSIYAKVMAKYSFGPNFCNDCHEWWDKTKAFAIEQGFTPEQLDDYLYEKKFGAKRVARAYLRRRKATQQPSPIPHSERPFR